MRDVADTRLLIIVAADGEPASLPTCLAAIVAQAKEGDAVLVACESERAAAIVRRDFPAAQLLTAPPGTLAPQLWRDGLRWERGRDWPLVALTTAQCVPDAGWLAGLRAAVAGGDAAGVGGAIEPGAGLGAVDWAIYLQRYSGAALPLPPGPATDLPGDNAAYRRAPLDAACDALGPLLDTGFWEPFFHAEMRRRGEHLAHAPAAVTRYGHSYGAAAFCRQRFRHAWYYGAWRADGQGRAGRVVRVLAAPLVPGLLLWRIAGRLRRKGRFGRECWRALPLLFLFLCAWALGEAAGALAGPSRATARREGATA